MYSKILWLCLLLFVSIEIKAQVRVYPFPINADEFVPKSAEYQVFVFQNDKKQDSFVYSSKTNFEKPEQQRHVRNHPERWLLHQCPEG